jgi:hypothetical protein
MPQVTFVKRDIKCTPENKHLPICVEERDKFTPTITPKSGHKFHKSERVKTGVYKSAPDAISMNVNPPTVNFGEGRTLSSYDPAALSDFARYNNAPLVGRVITQQARNRFVPTESFITARAPNILPFAIEAKIDSDVFEEGFEMTPSRILQERIEPFEIEQGIEQLGMRARPKVKQSPIAKSPRKTPKNLRHRRPTVRNIAGDIEMAYSPIAENELEISQTAANREVMRGDLEAGMSVSNESIISRLSSRLGAPSGARYNTLQFATNRPRLRSFSKAFAGFGSGTAAALLTSQMLNNLGHFDNQYLETGAKTGEIFTAGAVGDVVGRSVGRGTAVALTEGAGEGLAKAGAEILEGGLKSVGKGGAFAVAGVGVDYLISEPLLHRTFHLNHTKSQAISGGIVGGLASAAYVTMEGGLASGPETGGVSTAAAAVVSGTLITTSAVLGLIFGRGEDKAEEERKKQNDKQRKTSEARSRLIKSLPQNGYSFNQALLRFDDREALDEGGDSWQSFKHMNEMIFNATPQPVPKTPPQNLSGDDKRIDTIFNQYVTHKFIQEICQDEEECSKDPGEITEDDQKFMEKKAGDSWKSVADVQLNVSLMSKEFKEVKIKDSMETAISRWNNDQEVLPEDSPEMKYISLNPENMDRLMDYIQHDSQKRVLNAYNTKQIKVNSPKIPEEVRKHALSDPHFESEIYSYYHTTEDAAKALDLPVRQTLQIMQQPDDDEKKIMFRQYQMQNARKDPEEVNAAIDVSKRRKQALAAQFYDIDAQFLAQSNDPSIKTWQLSDSQIMYAHNNGMTLQEYADYVNAITARKKTALPVYTSDEKKQQSDADYLHLQDELGLAGYDPNLIDRRFKRNPNARQDRHIDHSFSSSYIPESLQKQRRLYAETVRVRNAEMQHRTDVFNARLRFAVGAEANRYNLLATERNRERIFEHPNEDVTLDYVNAELLYEKNKLTFTPQSERLQDAPKEAPTMAKEGKTLELATDQVQLGAAS